MQRFLFTWILALSISLPLFSQNEPIIIEAESGNLGSELTSLNQDGIQYITVTTDVVNSQNPGRDNRITTYTVTFPVAGTYELYARIRVGANNFNDDSFFYSNGFGTKSATNDNDWITTNGLSPVGYTSPTHTVLNAGTASTTVWKWIKLSGFDGGETSIRFVVPAGNLTQTFQIGGRENGLDFDKFAFGLLNVYYTVQNLDNRQSGTSTPPPPPYTPSGPPLATGKAKFLGGVYSTPQLPNFTAYWNQVTPENAGKWGSIEATRDVMNWTELDAAYNLAKNNGFPFRFHVLIWGNQQPAWIETLPPAEQLEEIQEWFTAVAQRYPAIDFVEVVNEPTNDPPNQAGNGGGNYIEALGGNGTTGWDWILNAFRMARQIFPSTTKLMINDYNVENNPPNAQRYLTIINLLKAENLIDIVGMQGHAFSTRIPASDLKNNIDFIASAGLPIQITELDIDGPTDQIQLDDYKRIFPVFWEHPAVQGITLWGYRPGHWRTAQGAYLALDNGAERPALVWLKGYVRNNQPTITQSQLFTVSEQAVNGTVLGTVQANDPDTATLLQNWAITGGTGAGIFAINAVNGQLTLIQDSVLDFETTSTYTLTLTVRDEYITSASAIVTIQVRNENEAPTAHLTTSSITGFAPHAISFDASASTDPDAGDTLQYTWNFGDGTTGNGAITSHTYTRPGNFTAILTVSDLSGLTDTVRVAIVVNPGLKVQYKVRQNEINPTDNHIRPFFQIVNIGDKVVPYNELTIRYWYTRENATYPWAQDNSNQQFWCDYATVGTNKVKGNFVALTTPRDSANYYLQVSFTLTSGLLPGNSSGEIQTRFNNANWSNFTEWGDYSYDPAKQTYTDWTHITLYRNGELIWGTEPQITASAARTNNLTSIADSDLLHVYPNPSIGGQFTLDYTDSNINDPLTLQIFDWSGKQVRQQTLYERSFTQTQPLKPGMYIIKVSAKKQSILKKLIVQ